MPASDRPALRNVIGPVLFVPRHEDDGVAIGGSALAAPDLRRLPTGGHLRKEFAPPSGSFARRLGSVVSDDAHVCACVPRREARNHVQCHTPRFCGIPSKGNIERQAMRSARKNDAALTSIRLREGDESLHLARGPNFELHAKKHRAVPQT
jgi:hypothetical protein